MLYFAYGSNMHRPMMRRRCPGARPHGRAVLAGWRFILMRNGYASVAPAAGARHAARGVLWRLTPRDVAVLNAYENLDGGLYRAVSLPVRAGHASVRALVYVGNTRAGRRRLRERAGPGYRGLIVDAAREAGLPPQYIRNLQRISHAVMGLGVSGHER
jgi:hypothetical protein